MAVSRRTLTTLGVAAGAGVLAGAGQLGVGYGLGILRWDRDFTADTWHAQLAWVAFLAAVAVISGAVAGRWRAAGGASGLGPRAALVAAATLGSLVVLPLVIRPAGASHLAESGDPKLIAAMTVGAGLALGVVAAVAVLSVPVVSGNIVSWIVWVWLAGTLSAVTTLGRGASWGTARLGLLPATGVWVPVALLGAAAVIAAAVAGLARLGGNDPRFTGASGAAGPVVVGAAYLIAGSGSGVAAQAYRYALIAVVVGVAVSVPLALLGRRPGIAVADPGAGMGASIGAGVTPPVSLDPWESSTTGRTPDYGWPAAPTSPGPAFATRPALSAPTPPAPLPVVPPAPAPLPPIPTRARPVKPEPEPEPEPDTGATGTLVPRRKGLTVRRRGRPESPEPPQPRATQDFTPEVAPPSIPRPRAESQGVPEEPAGRPGRRSRRRAEDSQPAPESDYVDWVKGLSTGGGDGTVRVGGTARHAKPSDRPGKS
jgi:hypothetical protein